MRAAAALLVAAVLTGCGDSGGGVPTAATPAATPRVDGGPTGDFVVDERTLHLECRGSGEPTVVLESGLGVASSPTWLAVHPALEETTRTCLYDRAGTGASPPAPKPRTSAAMVRDLRALLRVAKVPGPYVIVGASLGGLNAQLFAKQAPADVAGLVLVDAIPPDFDRRFAEVMGRRDAQERAVALAQNPEGVRFADLLASDREVRSAGPLPDVPIRVLVHGISFDPGGQPVPRLEKVWRELAAELAGPGGAVIVAAKSHHRIAEDEPDVVVQAVRDVLAEAGGGA